MEDDFEVGLCECMSDCNNCTLSFCCPCVVYAQNVAAMSDSDSVVLTKAPINCLLYFVVLWLPFCSFPLLQVPRAGRFPVIPAGESHSRSLANSNAHVGA